MRTILILLINLSILGYADESWFGSLPDLNTQISQTSKLYEKGDPISLEQLRDLKKSYNSRNINPWMMSQAELEKTRSDSEPLRNLAIELATSVDDAKRYYGSFLLGFLEPTKQTKDLLINLAKDSDSSISTNTLDTLFKMQWDTPEIREYLVADLKRIMRGEVSKTTAFNFVGDWGVVEAIPTCVKILEKTFITGELNEKGILKPLRDFGTEAKPALPILKQILQKYKESENFNIKELKNIDYTIFSIEKGDSATLQEKKSKALSFSKIAQPDSIEKNKNDKNLLIFLLIIIFLISFSFLYIKTERTG